MSHVLLGIVIAELCLVIVLWLRHTRTERELNQHSITAEDLHSLLASNREILLFDVRQPLDLLANLEIIPGAIRIPPKEVLNNPSMIPKDKDSIIYCTCPTDKTARTILHRALAMGFHRVKILKEGLDGWKYKGYPVEPYSEPFHLYAQPAPPPERV